MPAALESFLSDTCQGARKGTKIGLAVSAANAGVGLLVLLLGCYMNRVENSGRSTLTLNTAMGAAVALHNMIMAPIIGTVTGAGAGAMTSLGKSLYTLFAEEEKQDPEAINQASDMSKSL